MTEGGWRRVEKQSTQEELTVENKKYNQGWHKAAGGERFPKTTQENKRPYKALTDDENKKTIQNFRDLKVWQLGKEIVVETYKLTQAFPSEELYGLISQMRRAAVSIPCNVSEGHSRRATRDYQRFLGIAAGSCAELETQVEVALELSYLKTTACENIMEKIDYERCMLRKLISKLSENAIRHPSSSIQNKEPSKNLSLG
jgi:four helix bundle protein